MSTLMSRWSSPMPLRMVWPDSWSVETRNDGSSAASIASATPSFSWSAFDFGSIAISTGNTCVWTSSTIARSHSAIRGVHYGGKSLPIYRLRIEQPIRIHKRQLRTGLAGGHGAGEAGGAAGVAGGSGLLDPDPDRVLIAIDPHLDHALDMAGAFALSPKRVTGATEIPGFPISDSLAQGFVVHMRDHQHLAGAGIGRHAGHEARCVEFGLEGQPFLDVIDHTVIDRSGCGHGQSLVIASEGLVSAASLAPWTENAPAPPDCRGTCPYSGW